MTLVTRQDVIDLAEFAGVEIKPATVRMWAHRGKIKRIGSLYDSDSVVEWLGATRRDEQDPRLLRSGAKPV